MGPALAAANVPVEVMPVDRRVVVISLVAIALAGVAAVVAQGLMRLIWLITNISFHGVASLAPGNPPHSNLRTPMGNHVGLWVILIPAIRGLIVGLMTRYRPPSNRR